MMFLFKSSLKRSDCERSVKNTSHSWQSPICLQKIVKVHFWSFLKPLSGYRACVVPQTYLIHYKIVDQRAPLGISLQQLDANADCRPVSYSIVTSQRSMSQGSRIIVVVMKII